MSAAVAEPPAAVQAEAIVSEVNDSANQVGDPVTFTMSEMLGTATKLAARDGHGRSQEKPKDKTSDIPPDKKEEKPADQQKQEAAKENDKKEDKPAEIPEIKHNAGHFKVVTEARDKAVAEATEWKKKHDELLAQTEPLKQSATKLTDYEKQLAEERKLREELQTKVREIDIAQDPEFRQKYDAKITSGMEEVLGYLVSAGVAKPEATELVKQWDLRGIAEASADMDEVSKGLMMSAIRDTQRVSQERQQQLKQPEDFASKRRLQMEEQQKQAVQQRQTMADKILNGMLDATPELKEEAHAAFRTKIQTQLTRAAKGEMPVQEVLAMVAQAEALQMGLAGQHAALVEMDTENKSLKAKVAELETFIKNSNGTLKTETGQTKGTDDEKPSWERIKVV